MFLNSLNLNIGRRGKGGACARLPWIEAWVKAARKSAATHSTALLEETHEDRRRRRRRWRYGLWRVGLPTEVRLHLPVF